MAHNSKNTTKYTLLYKAMAGPPFVILRKSCVRAAAKEDEFFFPIIFR